MKSSGSSHPLPIRSDADLSLNPDAATVEERSMPQSRKVEAYRRGHSLVESVDSNPEQVRTALQRVSRSLDDLGVAKDDRHAVEMVLAECMNNVVEHAFGERPGSHFELKLRLSGDNLFCRVEDNGKPMPDLTIPTGERQDLSVDLADLPEGGFGWFLIRELTRNLHYERANDRNSLSFSIQLGKTDL